MSQGRIVQYRVALARAVVGMVPIEADPDELILLFMCLPEEEVVADPQWVLAKLTELADGEG